MPFQNLFIDYGWGGIRSVLEQQRSFSCVGYPGACMVAGPHGPGCLPVGYLKECIYGNCLHRIQELKRPICYEIMTINQEQLCQGFDNSVNHFKQGCGVGIGMNFGWSQGW
jgi:hypothetical protein